MPLTRRQFVHRTTAAVAGLQASACASSPVAGGGFIDSHVHVWSPDLRRYPTVSGRAATPASFTPEDLFRHTRPAGVGRVVLIQPGLYGTDNRYLLDSMAAHPGVFSGVAIVDESAPGLPARMKDLARQGIRGFRIRSASGQSAGWTNDAGMRSLWATAADEGLNVCLLINPEDLAAVDRMCLQFPRTPVVVDHFARVGMKDAITRAHLDRLLHLSVHKHLTLKTSAFYTLGHRQPPYTDLGSMIRECLKYFGPERLMWGSDAPHQLAPGHGYAASKALIEKHLDFLSASDKAWLLGKTAHRVFFQG